MMRKIKHHINNLIDKYLIYVESFFSKGKLPYKYKGICIIENTWVIHYECLSVNDINVDNVIKSTERFYKFLEFVDRDLKSYKLLNDKDLKYLHSKIEAILKVNVEIFNPIFFNQFKLQNYSEYNKERRNSIINNLIN